MPLLFSITLFISAALLFCVQPMIAKLLLPKLGGSPAVWNACMVFFQVTLLAGYAYAHATTAWLGVRKQAILHALPLLLPLAVLPIGLPADATQSLPHATSPIPWLLSVLLLTVGLPFFVVATTGPLLQKWFTTTGHSSARDPYFLYAASNLGSMVGLVGYPVVLEPLFPLQEQGWLWSLVYGAFVVLAFACALVTRRASADVAIVEPPLLDPEKSAFPEAEQSVSLTIGRRLRWIALAFVPSSLMLGVTIYLTTDIAAIPLLWAIPLALYLLSFILTFASRPVLPHRWMVRALPMLVMLLTVFILAEVLRPIWLMIPIHLLTFFVASMVCHGELARDRPPSKNLTEFYLWLSAGGALGGLFNALLAPVLFNPVGVGAWFANVGLPREWAAPLAFHRVAEYPLALVLVCWLLPTTHRSLAASGRRWLDWLLPAGVACLAVGLTVSSQSLDLPAGPIRTSFLFGLPALLCFTFVDRPVRFALGIAAFMMASIGSSGIYGRTVYVERNFFGVLRVIEDKEGQYRRLVHGNTMHGQQSLDPARRNQPTGYYHPTGPLGQIFAAFHERPATPRVGIVGLGTGGMACYARPGQVWTYYEIDPAVERIARDTKLFTFLADSPAQSIDVVLGDARLRLQEASPAEYGLFIIDAFSSDSIPMHLVTREALELYRERLAPGGLLAFHISNRYLNLKPVLGNLARDADFICLTRDDLPNGPDEEKSWERMGKQASMWVVMARQTTDLRNLVNDARWRPAPVSAKAVWSDDFSNILSAFLWQ